MATPIQNKVASMLNEHKDLGNKLSEEKDAGYGGKMQEYQKVNFYSHAVMGGKAYDVSGSIKTKYTSLGGHGEHPNTHQRLFGFPLTGVQHSIEAGVYMSIFEFGCIYSNSGGIYLSGRIFGYYKSLNYDRSWLGLPIADPITTANYETQYFELGGLCLDLASKKIIELHWTTPQLGYPALTKGSDFGDLHMITITSTETAVNQATAKNLVQAFENKLSLKTVGTDLVIPMDFDRDNIKTYTVAPSPGHTQDVHKFTFKMTADVPKNNTLYDINLKLPGDKVHTLAPHSIYIKYDLTNCSFAHITDLHLARRYDGYRKKLLENGIAEKQSNKFNNFNDALRQFIRYANKLHDEGKLDFIICTGDLVDYIFEDADGEERFTNLYSNFKFFEQIIRNSVPSSDQQKGEELKVPIFTSLGNHDYRVQSYYLDTIVDLQFPLLNYEQEQWSSANLIHEEAKILGATISPDRGLAAVIPDVDNNNQSLNYYFKHINRKKNYEINVGANKIIMMNGKWDSAYTDSVWDGIALKVVGNPSDELKQFATGSPNSIGFDDNEIEFLKKAISTTVGSVIIGVHNPLVNVIDSNYPYHLRESIRKNASSSFEGETKKFLFRKSRLQTLQTGSINLADMVKNHKGWSLTKSPHFATGDGDDLLDYGIMRGNKKKFLKLCAGVDLPKPVNLVLSGHIHANWECRVSYNKATDDFNFYSDFYTDNPSSYYYGVDVGIDPQQSSAWVGAPETKYEVEVGSMTEVVDVDAKIKKRDDGTFVLKTIPNGGALSMGGRNKDQWWKMYSPLLIQTEALGPMNSQRGEAPHNPDFRGCRLISIKDTIITDVNYITKAEIRTAVG